MSTKRLIKQKSYEKVAYVLRRHWLVLLRALLPYPILAILPIGIYWVLRREVPDLFINQYAYPLLITAASLYYFSVLLFALNAFLDYYLGAWIVTNDRIINIVQSGLFSRKISEMDIFKVQDATSDVKGVFATMFNYGDVLTETAAEQENFDFKQIKNPNEVRHRIIELADEDRKYHVMEIEPTVTH